LASKISNEEKIALMKLYALLCYNKELSTRFLSGVGDGLRTKTRSEMIIHYKERISEFYEALK
jgi:hypothetical protein